MLSGLPSEEALASIKAIQLIETYSGFFYTQTQDMSWTGCIWLRICDYPSMIFRP